MSFNPVDQIAQELSLKVHQVESTLGLLNEGATVPFIARYRKERTDSLDEVQIAAIRDLNDKILDLEKRRASVLKSLEDRSLLTEELKSTVEAARTLSVLEDVYLPYRPKKRTRASRARERGLQPLAELIFVQGPDDPETFSVPFVNQEMEIPDTATALAGARDIVAEHISEDGPTRAALRDLYLKKGRIQSKVVPEKQELAAKFKDYFDWSEPIDKIPSHRLLAMFRGEREGMLNVNLAPDDAEAIDLVTRAFVKGPNKSSEHMRLAAEDALKRLLGPSMETEIRRMAKEAADLEAIRVFAENLRQLLHAPPLGQKRVMAIDPGIRTGCKIVCMDAQGQLLHHDVIFPLKAGPKAEEAVAKLQEMVKTYQVESIAIGNGTGGRETQAFVKRLEFETKPQIILVNESGASIYSASKVAREEFPDHDITVRGAVSIGRRLMDPLAELVKIDPKSIGVGQYQHDVDQPSLKRSLDDVVMSCVNAVGVEVNTASRELLTYVSGLGSQLGKNIVAFRNEHGAFKSREDLLKVPRLGSRAYQQAAGFLRIRDGENPLDRSAVHPESYPVVDRMAKDLECEVPALLARSDLKGQIDLNKYVTETIGIPTLTDILEELEKPGRDPRDTFEPVSFTEGVNEIADLKVGMKLPGVVTNITNFGAFVDIGVHQDGLVHVSQIADRFVKDPSEIVKVQQKVMVTVMEVDLERKRISLSMRAEPGQKNRSRPDGARPVGEEGQESPRPRPRPNRPPRRRNRTGRPPVAVAGQAPEATVGAASQGAPGQGSGDGSPDGHGSSGGSEGRTPEPRGADGRPGPHRGQGPQGPGGRGPDRGRGPQGGDRRPDHGRGPQGPGSRGGPGDRGPDRGRGPQGPGSRGGPGDRGPDRGRGPQGPGGRGGPGDRGPGPQGPGGRGGPGDRGRGPQGPGGRGGPGDRGPGGGRPGGHGPGRGDSSRGGPGQDQRNHQESPDVNPLADQLRAWQQANKD